MKNLKLNKRDLQKIEIALRLRKEAAEDGQQWGWARSWGSTLKKVQKALGIALIVLFLFPACGRRALYSGTAKRICVEQCQDVPCDIHVLFGASSCPAGTEEKTESDFTMGLCGYSGVAHLDSP